MKQDKDGLSYRGASTPQQLEAGNHEYLDDLLIDRATKFVGKSRQIHSADLYEKITEEDNEYLVDGANRLTRESVERLSKGSLQEHNGPTHEFTWRSAIIGTIIGCVMAAQNVYFGLRNGSSFGDGIVASLIGFTIIKALSKRIPMRHFNLQEHVVLQTAATANISTIFAGGFSQYILAMTPQVQKITGLGSTDDTWNPTYGLAVTWLLVASFLGFFMAQLYRKKLIVEQDLPWPSGTATALVCKALHSDDGEEANLMTTKITQSTACAFIWQWFKWLYNANEGMESWPIFGAKAASYFWVEDWSPAYIAGGMLMNTNAALSMALGGIYGYGFILPYVTDKAGQEGWYEVGASSMKGPKAYWFLTSLAVAVSESIYQSIKICYISIRHHLAQRNGSANLMALPEDLEPEHRQVPKKIWVTGFALNTVLVLILVPIIYNVEWYLILPVICYSIPLGYGIILGGALTDSFLLSAIAKLTVIVFGSISSNVVSVLWLSGVGMITVGACEVLMSDYRVGYLTGTSSRAMFKVQFFAALVGCFITPLSYKLFLSAFEITEKGKFQAPGGVALRSLAVLFVKGFNVLPGHVANFVFPTVAVCLVNSLLCDVLPERYSRFLPNSMAFAIGFYVKGSYPLNAVIGMCARLGWRYLSPQSSAKFNSVVAGGMIAGEGLAAITQAIFALAGIEQPKEMAISFGNSE